MSKQYHYLVAGLPDLFIDDSKLSISTVEYRDMLTESMSGKDMQLIRLFFYEYDNQNVLKNIKNADSAFDKRGNLSETELETAFDMAKEGVTEGAGLIPTYIVQFISAYKSETPIFEGKSWELQLSELYYEFVTSASNDFVSDWFKFQRDMQNLITAVQCRKYNVPVENQLIGKSELTEKLSRSNARDFGIDSDFIMLEPILKATEEEDLLEFEKKIDRIKWDYLDDRVFFHYFTVEKLFAFLIKLSIVERWLELDKETGRKLFNELLSNLEAGYEFPEEFKLKK